MSATQRTYKQPNVSLPTGNGKDLPTFSANMFGQVNSWGIHMTNAMSRNS